MVYQFSSNLKGLDITAEKGFLSIDGDVRVIIRDGYLASNLRHFLWPEKRGITISDRSVFGYVSAASESDYAALLEVKDGLVFVSRAPSHYFFGFEGFFYNPYNLRSVLRSLHHNDDVSINKFRIRNLNNLLIFFDYADIPLRLQVWSDVDSIEMTAENGASSRISLNGLVDHFSEVIADLARG